MKWYFISTFRFIYIYLLHFVFLLLFLFFLLFGFLRPCYLFGWMLIFFLLVISFHCSSIYMRFPFSIYLFFAQRFITGLCLIQNSFGCVFSVCCWLLLLCFVTFFLCNLRYITGYLYAFLNFVFNDRKCLSLCYYCYYFSFFSVFFRLDACMLYVYVSFCLFITFWWW